MVRTIEYPCWVGRAEDSGKHADDPDGRVLSVSRTNVVRPVRDVYMLSQVSGCDSHGFSDSSPVPSAS